jgi:hypothetical protein
MVADPAWKAAQRLEGLAGEVRVNLIASLLSWPFMAILS